MNKRKNLTISKEMLPAYREYLRDEERSRVTVEKYPRDVRVFLEYVGENQVLGKERIRGCKEELRERYKISSANSMLAAVNSFLMFLGREEPKVKLFRVQKVLYSRPKREMTGKDYEKLVRTVRQCRDLSMGMLLQTIGSTGIHISELQFITMESLKAGRTGIYNKGKSRMMLLPAGLNRIPKKYCREAEILTGSIFVTKHRNPVNRSNMSEKAKQLTREAGVSENRVFPHDFRHLFARMFYSMEKDVVKLMDLLGYASINTTGTYTMAAKDQPRRQMSRIRMVLG